MNKLYSLIVGMLLLCLACKDSKNSAVEIESISTSSAFSVTSLATKQLNVDVYPSNITQEYTLKYESSDPTVASISDDGLIKARQSGSAIISVWVDGRSDINSRTMVTVVPFTLQTDDSISINVGESIKILATLNPIPQNGCTLLWQCAQPDIAAVDNEGNVQGLAAGNATVYISMKEDPEVVSVSYITVKEVFTDNTLHKICVEPLQTFNITEAIGHETTFAYQTAAPSIVTVSGEIGTAVAEGDAYIYAYRNAETVPCDSLLVQVVSNVNIPDANFRNRIIKLYDANGDKAIQISEISEITTLSISNLKIQDLTGIEYFKSLESLNCTYNQLKTLDVSKNPTLLKLHCYGNQLTSLNTTNCNKMNYLHCAINTITSLDLSTNTALTTLYCYSNQLNELDLSKNTALTYVNCDDNNLTDINIEPCTALTTLICSNNDLTSLNSSNNLKISTLTCNNNKLAAITLNSSQNHALSSVNMENNRLTEFDLTKCKSLVSLYAGSNRLTALDFSLSTKIQTLSCEFNRLETLDLSKQTVLKTVICNNNALTSLSTNSTALTKMWCHDNALSVLDISKDKALSQLMCQNNAIQDIDLSNNANLRNIIISNNDLSSLDVSKNTDLGFLNCLNNPLEVIFHTKNADTDMWSIPVATRLEVK